MKLKLSQILTVGLTTVIFNSMPQAYADQPTQPQEVAKSAVVTITFDINSGADRLRPSTKKCTDKPCVAYVRSNSKHSGSYTLDVPMFNMHKVSALKTRDLPSARVMMNEDNSFYFTTTINA